MCVVTGVYFRCGCLFTQHLNYCDIYIRDFMGGYYDEYADHCCRNCIFPSQSESADDPDEPTERDPPQECTTTVEDHYLVFGHPPLLRERCFRWRLEVAWNTGQKELTRVVSGRRPEDATGEAWEERVKEILTEQTAVLTGRCMEEGEAREATQLKLYNAIDGLPYNRLLGGICELLAEILQEQAAKALAEQDAKIADAEERRKRVLGL